MTDSTTPKHTCTRCQDDCDYHFKIGDFAVFSCKNCQSTWGNWTTLIYFSIIIVALKLLWRTVDFSGVPETVFITISVALMCILIIFRLFGHRMSALRIRRLDRHD